MHIRRWPGGDKVSPQPLSGKTPSACLKSRTTRYRTSSQHPSRALADGVDATEIAANVHAWAYFTCGGFISADERA